MSSGFSLGETVNSAADWVGKAPILHTIMNNPIYTTLLFLALAAVVLLAFYGDAVRAAGAKTALRAALFFFLGAIAIMFVHHRATGEAARETAYQKGVRDVFAGIQQSRETTGGGTVPVAGAPGNALGSSPSGPRVDNVSWDDLKIEDVVLKNPVH
jgi:hypothetical protein